MIRYPNLPEDIVGLDAYKVHISGFAISRVVDGKIIEDVAYFDVLGMLQQLGFKIIPPQGQN